MRGIMTANALFVLVSQTPNGPTGDIELRYCSAADTLSEIDALLVNFEKDLEDGEVLAIYRFVKDEEVALLRSQIRGLEETENPDDREDNLSDLEARLETFLFPDRCLDGLDYDSVEE